MCGGVYASLVEPYWLRVEEVEGYDRETNTAPGDDDYITDADVLIYEDEDERGRQHQTWRLMTRTAVDAICIGGEA